MTWVGVALACMGLMLLTGNNPASISFSYGQLITIAGAVAIAAEILLISHYARSVDLRRVTVLQLAVASIAAFALMPLAGETEIPPFSWTLTGLAVALGCASALIQLTMNWAQRTVDPARATLIYAGEPVWAGIFGRIAGERLAPLALVGGALVVLGVIVSEWKPRLRRARASATAGQASHHTGNRRIRHAWRRAGKKTARRFKTANGAWCVPQTPAARDRWRRAYCPA